jgi:hypothetical protein
MATASLPRPGGVFQIVRMATLGVSRKSLDALGHLVPVCHERARSLSRTPAEYANWRIMQY